MKLHQSVFSTDKIVSWDEGTGVVGVIDRDSIFSTPDYYGNFFKEKNFTDLSKFDVNGATVSVSGGNLNFSAGANTYTQSLDIKGNSALENFTITGRFKVGDKTSTSYGFGLGIRTTGVYAMYAFFNMTNGANSGKITLDNVVGLTTSTGLAFSVGDTIIFSLEKTRANVIVQAYNQTTKASPLRLTYNYTIYSPSPSLSWYGKYAIFSKGGLFSVDSISVFSKDIKNPDLLILGDSKTCAYQSTNYSDGYAQMLQAKYKNTDIYAAPGFQLQNALSTTNQIISLSPKAVLMALGSNDIRSGRTFAQYTADYDTIVNRFIAAGIQVYHALPFYEKPVNVKPLVDYVIATYPADKIIDTYNPMLATGALDADTL
ncbi:MAG: SGNH/GDSL hydrolase family protein, partial [Chitinophagaceae bacterium]|nr:SGNH/GDSL hydrolase family protein [Chitinophagaceae bacterium]